jgi:uncharacterized protein
MKILVTGGTGMIGQRLVDRLTQDGHQVVVLTRSSSARPTSARTGVRYVEWDSKSGAGWSDELRDTEAIINLAGANLSGGRWTRSRKDLILNSRLNAGAAIIDAVERSGHIPKRLIQASGISYYGDRRDSTVTETEGPGTDFLARVCIEWEQATAPLENKGVKRAVIRTAPVLDLEEGALPPISLPFLLFVGGRTGAGDQGFSWIHMDDQIEAIRFLLVRPELTGPFNLCSPEPVSNAELATTLGRVLNRPAFLPAPAFAFRLALGEVADTILLGQYALPQRLEEAGFRFKFPHIEEALRDMFVDRPTRTRLQIVRSGVSAAFVMLRP